MAMFPDYYIATTDTGIRPYPWSWELRSRNKAMGVRVGARGYQSQAAAEYAGNAALDRFLDDLSKEEARRR